MVAFIIFHHNRKGNEKLNLRRRVQEADSSTEGFSDGINLVLSKSVQIFDTQWDSWLACRLFWRHLSLYLCCQKLSAKKEAFSHGAQSRAVVVAHGFRGGKGSGPRGEYSKEQRICLKTHLLGFWNSFRKQMAGNNSARIRRVKRFYQAISKQVASKSFMFNNKVWAIWSLEI